MSNEPYERGLDIFRESEADEDFRTGPGSLSPEPKRGQSETSEYSGTSEYPTTAQGEWGLDDSQPTPTASDQSPASDQVSASEVTEGTALGSESDDDLTGSAYDPADDLAESPANTGGFTAGSSTGSGAAGTKEAAGHAVEKAGDVAGAAAQKAGELKDVALERGGDVAAVAKDELAKLAHEARSEVQSLWSSASEQLRGQAATGQQQLSELLHSLAGELGEMASKSENTGPLTALAKQAAAKGGEWSHWLANSEPADLLTEVRRFARRRPFVFLASAAVAGVVVGRLGRGLMAAGDTEHAATRMVGGSSASATSAGVTTPRAVTYDELPSFGAEQTPEVEEYPSQATAANPYGVAEGGAR